MKITEVTQKSRTQQLAEDKQKLDELVPVATGLAGAGLSGYMLARDYGLNPLKWPAHAWAELALGAGAGATGVGLGALATKAAGKRVAKGLAKRSIQGAERKIDKLNKKEQDILNKAANKDLKAQDKALKKAEKLQQKKDFQQSKIDAKQTKLDNLNKRDTPLKTFGKWGLRGAFPAGAAIMWVDDQTSEKPTQNPKPTPKSWGGFGSKDDPSHPEYKRNKPEAWK